MILVLIKKYWISLTLFILAVITVLSLSPLKELPPMPGSDKTHHLIAYAALMFPTALKKPDYWLAIVLFFVFWSGIIEVLQPYVNRYGELQDLIANIIGLILGWLAVQLIKRFFPDNSC